MTKIYPNTNAFYLIRYIKHKFIYLSKLIVIGPTQYNWSFLISFLERPKMIKRSEKLAKELTAYENEKLGILPQITDYKRRKLEEEAQKNWDRFYKRNSENFFKDRNWTKKELEYLCSDLDLKNDLIIIEAGCGCGNTLFPLRGFYPNWNFYGVDFSRNAVSLLKQRAKELDMIVSTRIGDLACDNLELGFPEADLVLLIFVLSSISKECQEKAVRNLQKMLKTGGSVIFRDYGAYDHAMMRFGRGSKIDERFYMRQDGTRAYYFFTDELQGIFEKCGFTTAKCDYVYKETKNIKEQICLDRVFIEGRFIKI